MTKINLLEAIKVVKEKIPSFSGKLLEEFQEKINDELRKRTRCQNCRNWMNGECWIDGKFQSKIEGKARMTHCFKSK